jgi:hypothetical protein
MTLEVDHSLLVARGWLFCAPFVCGSCGYALSPVVHHDRINTVENGDILLGIGDFSAGALC